MNKHQHCRNDRRAFTLIEVIMVVAIIAFLIAITVGIINTATKTAKRTAMNANMASIGTALEEYKKDHGGLYPQVGAPNTGFAELGKELIGTYGDGKLPPPPTPPQTDVNDPPLHDPNATYKPGDCVSGSNLYVCLQETQEAPPGGGKNWVQFNCRDGADGPGHSAGGRKFPAYLQPEKFRVRGCAILDANDKPILYFPARGRPNVTVPGANNTPSYAGLPLAGNPKYHINDNWQFFTREIDPLNTNAQSRAQAMLGDFSGDNKPTNFNGTIDSEEVAKANGPYILWAAGADEFFGPHWNYTKRPPTDPITQKDINNCDDVIFFAQ